MRYQEMFYGHEPGVGFVENYEEHGTLDSAAWAFMTDLEWFGAVNGTVVLGCESEPIISVDFRDGHISAIY